MTTMQIKIHVLSPIHLGSGQEDVNLDAEVIRDDAGFPFFPAKRFKGLLYESALEVVEMSELSGSGLCNRETLEEIFHHCSSSPIQLIVPNFYLKPTDEYKTFSEEWKTLQNTFPEILRPADVLAEYTTIRYQTKLEKGVAKTGSLHNMRVVDSGVDFYGTLKLSGGGEKHLRLLALALRNLASAGLKRNRGFGRVSCTMSLPDGRTEQDLIQAAFQKEAV